MCALRNASPFFSLLLARWSVSPLLVKTYRNIMADNSKTALCIDYYGPESMVFTAFLKAFGVDVVEAEHGFDAVGILQTGLRFNMITINMDLPFGLQTARYLRQMGVDAKLVGFTSQRREMIPEFTSAGLDLCVEKPITFLKLAEIIALLDE